jgi:hypothetical protein
MSGLSWPQLAQIGTTRVSLGRRDCASAPTTATSAELGRVMLGEEEGRRSNAEVTVFDSTGLAVQDLAVAIAVYERWRGRPARIRVTAVAVLDLP